MRAATTALVGALLAVGICLAITPARHWTQEIATCRGADVQRGLTDTTVLTRDGRTAEDFAFICRRESGPVGIGKTQAAIGGIGVSLVLGLVAGAGLGLLLGRRRRTR